MLQQLLEDPEAELGIVGWRPNLPVLGIAVGNVVLNFTVIAPGALELSLPGNAESIADGETQHHVLPFPANHAQAEDRCYRMGQTRKVTVEYFRAEDSLDTYIARLLETKIKLIKAVQADDVPDAFLLTELANNLRALAPALIEEVRLARSAAAAHAAAIERLAAITPQGETGSSPIESTGLWEFKSERDASRSYRVTYGRAGHLDCTCKGFEFRGNCKHVREVRATRSTSAG